MIAPLSIGRIVDRSVTLTLRHWRTLAVLVLIEAVPIGIARTLLPDTGMTSFATTVCNTFINLLLYPAAIFATVAPDVPNPATVLTTAARRYGSSLGALVVSMVWTILWFIVPAFIYFLALVLFAGSNSAGRIIVPPLAAAVAALAVLPRPMTVLVMLLPIVMLERVSPWTALDRARRRVQHVGFRRSWLLGVMIFITTTGPALVVSSAVDQLVAMTHLSVLRAIGEVVTNLASLGFGTVVGTVVTLEMRSRAEGADIEAHLDAEQVTLRPLSRAE